MGWLLTVLTCLLVWFAWSGESRDDADSEAAGDSQKLRIDRIQPLELSPGGTLAITFSGTNLGESPVRATLNKEPLNTLRASESTIVVRVPTDLPEGRAKIRVHQDEERSKKREVWLRPLDPGTVIPLALLGIALFVLGLRTLARGIRTYAGSRLRSALERLTRGVWRSMAVGIVTGAATQSTVTSAGVLVGLLGSSLLPITMALAIVLGAQLGSAAIALALPLGTRASVLLVALGIIWVSLSENRRSRALAKIFLGLGLLFFGFETLRTGFQPLVSHPDLVRYLDGTGNDAFLNTLFAVGAGALVTALLQGPGPAFVLVLGLAESTEAIGLHQALTILAGVPLGVAVGTSVVAWPFGGTPRRWAIRHLMMGAVSTLFLTLTVSFWVIAADQIVPGDPEAIGQSQRILMPAIAPHLVTGFLLSHGFVSIAFVIALPYLGRWLEPSRRVAKTRESKTVDGAEGFVAAIENLKEALTDIHQIWVTGDRAQVGGSEHALELAQNQLVSVLESVRSDGSEAASTTFSAGLALLEAQDSLVSMQRHVEHGVEWGVTPAEREQIALQRLHELISQGLDTLIHAIQSGSPADPDQAREREIWTNAEDSRVRDTLEQDRKKLGLRYVRHWSSVSAAYEELGNQLFRACDALLGEADD
jgi:hypothetical protein